MSRNLDLVRLLAQRNASPVAAAPAKSSSSASPAAAPSRSSPAVVSSAGSSGNSTQTASQQSRPAKSDDDSKQRLLSIYGGRPAKAPKAKVAPKANPEAVPKAPQPKPATKPKESESTKDSATGGRGLKRPAGRVLKRPASREMSNESDPPLKRPAAQCDSDQPDDDDVQNEGEESEGHHTGSSSGYSGHTPVVMFLKILFLFEPMKLKGFMMHSFFVSQHPTIEVNVSIPRISGANGAIGLKHEYVFYVQKKDLVLPWLP